MKKGKIVGTTFSTVFILDENFKSTFATKLKSINKLKLFYWSNLEKTDAMLKFMYFKHSILIVGNGLAQVNILEENQHLRNLTFFFIDSLKFNWPND